MRATIAMPAVIASALMLSGAPVWSQDQATLNVESSAEHGDYVTDAAGASLYMFEDDERGVDGSPGVSNCYDQCAENWPPLLVEGEAQAGEGVQSDLIGTTERRDGSMQVTYGGYPLYYFVRDEGTGDTNGQGVNDVWYLVSPSGELIEG
jgi:predicted lipoprotein with Yx(FWY)xxD motif